MSDVEIVNPVGEADADEWMRVKGTNLLRTPTPAEHAAQVTNRRLTWNGERVWAARDRGAIVGTLATEDRTLTVPGPAGGTAVVRVDALTGVSVSATHRRRGLLRRMLTDSLAAARDRGDPLSALIAAEWPIYGRYGYAPATQYARFTYRTRGRLAAPLDSDPTTVRPVEPDELARLAPDIYARARRQRAGQIDRDTTWWPRTLGTDGFDAAAGTPANWVLHETDGVADGLVGWRTTRDFNIDNRFGAIAVADLVATSGSAYRDLWGYVAGFDAVDEVTFDDRPVDEPIRWSLGDGRALDQHATLDGLWIRLLDVPAALAARAYAVPGELVLDVVDTDGAGYGAGRVALHAEAEGAQCEPTTRPADLRLTQRALAAAYLGGHRLSVVALGGGVDEGGVDEGGVDELVPGALARADLMFATALAPVNQTGF